MSTTTTCHGFVANTWRKDVCTNCFRFRDEHQMKNSVSGRFTSKFNPSSSSSSMSKTSMDSSRYSAESGGFHPSNSGDNNKDNTLPRISGGGIGTSITGRSVNMTQSHFGAGSTLSNSNSHNLNQKQQVLHVQKNKSSLHFNSGVSSGNSGGSRHASNVSFASGGQPKSDKFSRNSLGMDSSGDGERTSGSGGRKPHFSVGGPMRGAQRGILKSKDGSKISKIGGGRRGVSFPVEVVEVIGDDEPCVGTPSSDEDEEDTPIHPLDNASIAELLDKNSTTLDEKEFYRLTQKNTNFNSIKTNLLGKTNIEIGPIVGGTGGSSKPLVSIGTFETRNEPLKIRKKIDEDSSIDDYDKTVNTHRKFVTTTNKSTTSTTTPPARSTITGTIPAQKSNAQVPTTSSSSSSSTSAILDGVSSTAKSIQNMGISSKHATKSTKVSSTFDNSSASTSTATAKTVNYTTKSASPKRDSVDSSSKRTNPSVTISSAKDLSQWNDPEAKNEVGLGSSSKGPNNKPALKPKSILKCSQPTPATNKSPPIVTSPINNTIPPILSNKTVQLKGMSSSATKMNTGLTNLIILTEGNNIASKRTSFLRNIVDPEGLDAKKVSTSSSNAKGVTIVSTGVGVLNSSSSLEPSLEKDSLDSPHVSFPSEKHSKPKVPSKLKLNIDLSLDREVANPPKASSMVVSPSLRFQEGGNGSGTDSEFDDSLEDSGLDIKITKPHTVTPSSTTQAPLTNGQSEDKKLSGGSGGSSGSDSGNENDYTVSDNKCNGRVTKGHPGLYISVEDEEIVGNVNDKELELNVKKPPKLSPDSVLFNGGTASGSEMSASGSNESIPESCRDDDQVRRSSTTSTNSGTSKRQAPQPPNIGTYSTESPMGELDDDDDVYDDISNVQMMMTRQRLSSNELEIEDESIYDDCSTIYNESDSTITDNLNNSTNANMGKIGSYNFHKESSQFGDHNEDEPVIMQKSDGIEFIGIRKIDSESFLKEKSPTADRKFGFRRSISPSGKDSRERSSSTSPKARRKVNQFFSTIGKKAGAAFSNSQLGQYTRNKTPSVFNASSSNPDPTEKSYRRSMSTDEVSAIRAQEIYATVTPTTMKFKGVINKLSKMDLTDSKGKPSQSINLDEHQSSDPCKEKAYKKNQISKSIKKFLRFGNKDYGGAGDYGGKYDISQHHPLDISSPIHTPVSLTSSSDGSSYNNNSNPSSMSPSLLDEPSTASVGKKPPVPANKPPPPPPRIHSLDMLQKMGVVNQKGTVRPARPPPPVRPNQNTPKFIAVFNNPAAVESASPDIGCSPTLDVAPSSLNSSDNDGMIPPCKPRRKNSVNHSSSGGKDLETSYNHISNLNLETLKLIANQALTKIVSNFPIVYSEEKVQWSQFDMQTGMRPEPLIHGMGFAIYSAHFEGTKCLLMIQEYSNKNQPFQFSCVQTELTSQDVIVPNEYIPWNASENVMSDIGTQATLSILPFFKMWKLEDFIKSPEIVRKEKHLALLQSLDYWELEELSNLLVFKQPHIISSDRIYIHPLPVIGRKQSNNLSSDFEVSIKQLLFTSGDETEDCEGILSSADKQILIEKVSGGQEEVKSQLKLFFQLKLFAPPMESGEFLKIRKYRSEHAIQQWLDKERASCMKEAVERSLSGGSITLDAITPLKKAYLEFLMRPGNSAKAILDMFVELFE